MPTAATLLALLVSHACSSSSRVVPAPSSASPGAAAPAIPKDADTPARDAGRNIGSAPAALTPEGDFPTEAWALLTQSTTDSCAICAERHRKEAFERLDLVYRPGTVVATTAESRFVRVADGDNELALTSYRHGDPKLTFRFHTASNRLIGVADGDLTEEVVAQQLLSMPDGASLQGALVIIAYAYGDGPTYLYSPTRNHLQIQCRILGLVEE